MAFAIARSLSWLAIGTAAVTLGVFATAPAARTAEQVYVWRDANGIVQFTTVQAQPAPAVATGTDDSRRERDHQLAVNDGR